MGNGPLDSVQLDIEFSDDADADRAEHMSQQLRAELAELGLARVTARQTDAPPGARGGGVDWSTLMMSLNASGGAITMVLAIVKGWLGRNRLAHGVELKVNGVSIHVTAATTQQQEEMIQAFLRKLDNGEPAPGKGN
jgi:Effector Associated Constant Component 1